MTLSLRLQSTNRSFERLYRAHVGDVYRYALAITGNAADAEDVAQTTFMNAYRALERSDTPAWAVRMCSGAEPDVRPGTCRPFVCRESARPRLISR